MLLFLLFLDNFFVISAIIIGHPTLMSYAFSFITYFPIQTDFQISLFAGQCLVLDILLVLDLCRIYIKQLNLLFMRYNICVNMIGDVERINCSSRIRLNLVGGTWLGCNQGVLDKANYGSLFYIPRGQKIFYILISRHSSRSFGSGSC